MKSSRKNKIKRTKKRDKRTKVIRKMMRPNNPRKGSTKPRRK